MANLHPNISVIAGDMQLPLRLGLRRVLRMTAIALLLCPSLAMAQGDTEKPDIDLKLDQDIDLSPKGGNIETDIDLGDNTSIGIGSLGKGDAFPKESAPNVEPPGKFDPKDDAGGIILKHDF